MEESVKIYGSREDMVKDLKDKLINFRPYITEILDSFDKTEENKWRDKITDAEISRNVPAQAQYYLDITQIYKLMNDSSPKEEVYSVAAKVSDLLDKLN
ncbi:MAG: hypothetical protein KAT28_05220 [Candidatus Aenigmarchaeota archaeon]|nr:hypothetical protein [Candidatus Aenigmarchaeota archaeon]